MGRTPLFDMSTLKAEAAQVKRRILARVKDGDLDPEDLNKTDCIKMLAARPKLRLQSDRPLYDKGERQAYLDDWFQGVWKDAKEQQAVLRSRATTDDSSRDDLAIETTSKGQLMTEVEELRQKAAIQARTIQEYRKALDVLRAENQDLRVKLEDKRKRYGQAEGL